MIRVKTTFAFWMVALIPCGFWGGCGTVSSDQHKDSGGVPSMDMGSDSVSAPPGKQAASAQKKQDEVVPLIIWGADGVPILNEAALPENSVEDSASVSTEANEVVSSEVTDKKSKVSKRKSKKSGKDTIESAEPEVTFIIKTNLPVTVQDDKPIKPRMQEFYEFTSRLNKRHSIPLPDAVMESGVDETPLFTQDELTSTNTMGEPMSLVTSFETRVQLVNEKLKFVVLDYSYEPMPPMDLRLAVFRAEDRIGTIKITGPVRDGTVVAIILDGTPKVGDRVVREIW